MKKVIALALSAVLALGCLAGCSGNGEPVAAGSTIKIGVLAPLTGTNAMKKVIALALSAVLALGCLAGCSGNGEPVAAGSTIKIGVLAPLTGTNAEYGKGFEVGTQMAVDRINAAGGINGRTLEGSTIKIGVLAPLTGTNAEYGKGFEVGTQMAVDRINAAGGINGRTLELEVKDSKGDQKESSDLCRMFADDQEVMAIIGDFASGACMAINGRTLELEVKDSKGDQKESSDLCRMFADDQEVMAIIGDFASGACMANAPIVDEAGVVQLSPTASNPDYAGMSEYCFSIMGRQDGEAPFYAKYIVVQLSPTASNPDYAGMSEYCFSIMGRQDGEAPFYAKYILNRYMGVKKLGVIYINSDWGKSCFENFKAQCDVEGLEIVEAVNYVQDEKDFSSLITKLKAANPDVVCIMDQGAVPQVINQIRGSGWTDIPITKLKAANPDVVCIMDQGAVPQVINQIRGSGWTDIPITTLGPGTSQQLIDLCGENAEGLLLTSPFFFDPDDADLVAWKDEFVQKAGFEPTIHPVCAYDCVNLLAEAIKACGDNVTRQNIRDNLAKVELEGVSGPVCAYDCVNLLAEAIKACGDNVTRQNIRDNLAKVELEGVSGPLKFNEAGDITRQYLICGVENGQYVIKEDFEYSKDGI